MKLMKVDVDKPSTIIVIGKSEEKDTMVDIRSMMEEYTVKGCSCKIEGVGEGFLVVCGCP